METIGLFLVTCEFKLVWLIPFPNYSSRCEGSLKPYLTPSKIVKVFLYFESM